ncbi:MAG: serine acetyltransferase [Muribaculaceae bacterium]|nr:serine acetyltransferase [Muribaculaceae bacterium]
MTNKLIFYYYQKKLAKYRVKTGIELNINVADYGIHIPHGKVVIHYNAKIGKNCKIVSDVTIGSLARYDKWGAPIIGDRVFIGSGAKIIGAIKIADDVVIGANSVVTKDISEPNTTWAGNPAKKVSDKGSFHYLNR